MKDKMISIKRFVQFVIAEPNFLLKLMKLIIKKENKLILFGTPVHGNLGDHLIGESEKQFLISNFPEYEYFECTMPFSKRFMEIIIKHTNKNTPIFISGGGWLGTEWRHNEEYVRTILTKFNGRPIFIFPQTVFYKDDDSYIETGRVVYSGCTKLFFSVRDKRSYDFLLNHRFISNNRLALLPDMALLYNQTLRNKRCKSNIIGVCFRDDIEAYIGSDVSNSVMDYLKRNNYQIKKIYTNIRRKVIRPERRVEEITKLLDEIASLDLLITDRLHAMVMAAITDTPCVAFDNSTHKVSGVYQWIEGLDYIQLVEDKKNAMPCIERMISADFLDHYDIERFNDSRKALRNIFKSMECANND